MILIYASIKIDFSYKRICVRCLNPSSNNEINELSSKVNIYEENDYELNHDDEYFDLEPIISEMIIDKDKKLVTTPAYMEAESIKAAEIMHSPSTKSDITVFGTN